MNMLTTPDLSIEVWQAILNNPQLTQANNITLLQVLYGFPNHCANAGKIAQVLNCHFASLNGMVGKWGQRVAQAYALPLLKREDGSERKWSALFNGWYENGYFIWQLKPNLVCALERMALVQAHYSPEEWQEWAHGQLSEGAKKSIVVNAYERNSQARQQCLAYWGYRCVVCGFDFQEKYGAIGKGFIHVHHLIPLSRIGQTYQVNPIEDLRPVCPNCHAMLHTTYPPMSIEALQEKIVANQP